MRISDWSSDVCSSDLEREMAAYCVLRGIDYIVEECPMAIGNKHLGYKEALNAIEATSPGSKFDFYFGFLARASEQFRPKVEAEQGDRKSVVEGKGVSIRVDLGGRRSLKKKNKQER